MDVNFNLAKFTLTAILACAANPAFADPGASDATITNATAQLITPIAITHDSDAALNFGTILPGNGGTVNVPVTGGHSTGGGVILLSGNTPSRDSFTVTGEPGRTFLIQATGGTISNGSATMTYSVTLINLAGRLDASGRDRIIVGGRLSVGANQPVGRYTGNYNVTVTYN